MIERTAKPGGRRPTVFLSHAHSNEREVRRVAKILADYDITAWLFEDEVLVGDSIIERIGEALKKADFIAFFISRASQSSAWVKTEVMEALYDQLNAPQRRLLPVRLDETESPPLIRHLVYADLSGNSFIEGAHFLARSIMQQFNTTRENVGQTFGASTKETISELSRCKKQGGFQWFIISGASCSGKDVLAYVVEQRLALRLGLRLTTKYTTRPRRQSEPEYVVELEECDFLERLNDRRLIFPYTKRHHRYAFDQTEFERSIREGSTLLSVFTDFILVPEIVAGMNAADLPVTSIFVEADKEHLLRRVLFRNLPANEIASRIRSIERDFLEANRRNLKEEYLIVRNGDDRSFAEAAAELIEIVGSRQRN